MTPPAMNTHSKKRLTVRHALEMNEDKILLDSEHFFTLANMMDSDLYVHLYSEIHVSTISKTSILRISIRDYR